MAAAPTDLSKPYIPAVGHATDGYSKENEATATCFCGTVQLAFVRPSSSTALSIHSHSVIYIYIYQTPRLICHVCPSLLANFISRRRIALRVPLPGLPQTDGHHVRVQLHGARSLSKTHPGPGRAEAVVSEPSIPPRDCPVPYRLIPFQALLNPGGAFTPLFHPPRALDPGVA